MPIVDATGYEQKKKEQQDNAMSLSSGIVNVSGAQSANTQQSAQQDKQAGSGTFTDIGKYQKANAPAAQQLSQNLQTNITNQTTDTANAITANQKDFNNNLSANQNTANTAYKNSLKAIASVGTGSTPNPSLNNNKNSFKNFTNKNTKYITTNYNDSAQAQKAKEIQSQTKQLERADVRRNLLRSQFGSGRNNYTSGQSSLDQAILNKDKNATSSLINNTRSAVEGLKQRLNSARNDSGASISSARDEVNKNREDVNSSFSNANTDLTKSIQSRIDQENKAKGGILDQIRNASNVSNYGDVNMSSELANIVGLTAGQNLYGVNIADYLKQGNTRSISSAATQQDLIRANALASLAGRDQNIIADTGLVGSNFSQKGITGQAELMAAIANQRDNYNNELANRKSQDNQYQQDILSLEDILKNSRTSNIYENSNLTTAKSNLSKRLQDMLIEKGGGLNTSMDNFTNKNIIVDPDGGYRDSVTGQRVFDPEYNSVNALSFNKDWTTGLLNNIKNRYKSSQDSFRNKYHQNQRLLLDGSVDTADNPINPVLSAGRGSGTISGTYV